MVATSDEWKEKLRAQLDYVQQHDGDREHGRRLQLETQLGAVKSRVTRLIDAFVDGALDKDTFEKRKRTLLEEERSLEDSLQPDGDASNQVRVLVDEILELASSAQQSYRLGNTAARRELAIRLCSNRSVAGKDVSIEPVLPLMRLAERDPFLKCAPQPYRARTTEEVARELLQWAKAELKKENESSQPPGWTAPA
jgi:hypothetical protein